MINFETSPIISVQDIKECDDTQLETLVTRLASSTNYPFEDWKNILKSVKELNVNLLPHLELFGDLFVLSYARTAGDFWIFTAPYLTVAAIKYREKYLLIPALYVSNVSSACLNIDNNLDSGVSLEMIMTKLDNISDTNLLSDFLQSAKDLSLSDELFKVIKPDELQSEETSRFSSALWFDKLQDKEITIAGQGGIGSWVTVLLSRLQPKAMYIYDDDSVEPANMSGQFYFGENVLNKKVDAIADLCRRFSYYYSISAIPQRFGGNSESTDIMICGFDNMRSRKLFFNQWLKHVQEKATADERKQCLFIDGRLEAESLQIFCIRGDNEYGILEYSNKYLFSDSEADATVCSYKQTTYMSNMIGGLIVNLFVNFVSNEVVEDLRSLPFLTIYDGSTMNLKTID